VLSLLEFYIMSYANKTSSYLNKEFAIVMLCFYKLKLKRIRYSNYFDLNLIHKRAKCTLQSCYLNFLVKSLIIKSSLREVNEDKSVTNFEENIVFEKRFKAYLESINETAEEMQDLWRQVLNKQIDWPGMLGFGKRISKAYIKVKKIYEKIKKEQERVYIIEELALRFHLDVMNFEAEADLNFEQLKLMAARDRLSRDQDLNLKQCLVVVSLNPASFHKIASYNKQF